jgi:hypothetical protein
MDYMTEIAAAALQFLCGDSALQAEAGPLTEEVETALKSEMGWSRFLDIWRDGSDEARRDLLADLLYRRPRIALNLVRDGLDGHYPALLLQLATQIRNSKADRGACSSKCDDELLASLLLSPETVLMLAELFEIPLPLSTAERALWSAAQDPRDLDDAKLTYLLTRLARLKEQLQVVGRTVELSTDAAMLANRSGFRNAVDREVEHTEASIRRLEQLLALVRGAGAAPVKRTCMAAFSAPCRPRLQSCVGRRQAPATRRSRPFQ